MRSFLGMGLAIVFSFVLVACGQKSEESEEWDYCAHAECLDGDGCCPNGCDSIKDSDCKPKCGNGIVEAGETCDGVCPTICGDSDECTTDTLVGDPDQCTADCVHEAIIDCVDDDGCCPSGCVGKDSDCVECGNGITELGETCDGNCPEDCDDGDACTNDSLSGSASFCTAKCVYEQVRECKDGDGCCAPGCNALTDQDCEPVCGNGVVEPGETCDPQQACPSQLSDCDDGDFCTEDMLVGSADTCSSECSHQTIETCVDGDGCCPQGCNSLNDDDCEPVCGNGILEDGELCDPPGSCPQDSEDCDDGDSCTIDQVFGFPELCKANCHNTAIVTCVDGDGCCPAGCNAFNDGDCSPCPVGMHPCENGCCEFSMEKLDGTMGSGKYGDMVLDSLGRLHVVYTIPAWTVVHAVYVNGGYWRYRYIFPQTETGLFPALDTDNQGNATVAFYQPSSENLMLASEDENGDFEAEAVFRMGLVNTNTHPIDLIVNTQGNPVVLFFDANSDTIKMAVRMDQWFIWPVAEAHNLSFLRAEQGDDGRIHVAWSELDNDNDSMGQLKYAVHESAHWSTETLDYFFSNGAMDLTLDSQGNPHVIAVKSSRELIHFWRSSSGWEIEHDISTPVNMDWLSLVIDADDILHMAMHDTQNDTLLYARKTGNRWSFVVPDSRQAVGIRPSICLDQDAQPTILHGASMAGTFISYW